MEGKCNKFEIQKYVVLLSLMCISDIQYVKIIRRTPVEKYEKLKCLYFFFWFSSGLFFDFYGNNVIFKKMCLYIYHSIFQF